MTAPTAKKRAPRTKAPAEPVVLSADAFRAGVKKRVVVDVMIPQLGGIVKIRNLTAGEYDECVELATSADPKNPAAVGRLDMDKLHQLTVIAAMEEPKLGPEEVEGILEWDSDIFARLLLAIRQLSGIREGAVDAAMSRFPAGTA